MSVTLLSQTKLLPESLSPSISSRYHVVLQLSLFLSGPSGKLKNNGFLDVCRVLHRDSSSLTQWWIRNEVLSPSPQGKDSPTRSSSYMCTRSHKCAHRHLHAYRNASVQVHRCWHVCGHTCSRAFCCSLLSGGNYGDAALYPGDYLNGQMKWCTIDQGIGSWEPLLWTDCDNACVCAATQAELWVCVPP